MHNRLAEILARKQNEVNRLKRAMPFNRDMERLHLRDFSAAISIPQKINLIAEIKFACFEKRFYYRCGFGRLVIDAEWGPGAKNKSNRQRR
ncbi:MAG: hypothetical protein PVI00_14040 [Desulfobacterales bacterium]